MRNLKSKKGKTIMKCQKCGISEVSYFYSSNVNGVMTETKLCSQCLAESGGNINDFFSQKQFIDFVSITIPVIQRSRMFPFIMHPQANVVKNVSLCDCDTSMKRTPGIEVDDEMSMRRDLNAKLRAAIDNEEFEKAAVLRDKIKELEAGRSTICDSETDSQGSQTAR
jgi:protein-arginine kinase activator protein McsA